MKDNLNNVQDVGRLAFFVAVAVAVVVVVTEDMLTC